jgi:hypothetical protein
MKFTHVQISTACPTPPPLLLLFPIPLYIRWVGRDCVQCVRRILVGLLYQAPMMVIDGRGAFGVMRIGKGNRSTRKKPAPVSLCSAQIPRDLNLN